MAQPISVSSETIVRVFLIALAAWALYEVRNILLLIFIALIFATILNPLAGWAKKFRIPRSITVVVIYILALAILAGIGFALAPLFVDEISQIAQNFSGYWDKVITLLPPQTSEYLKQAVQNNINEIVGTAKTGLLVTLTGLLSTVSGLISVVGSLVIVLVLTFYMVVEEQSIRRSLHIFTPRKYDSLLARCLTNIQTRLGGWARGQIVLSFIIGAWVFVMLTIIGVPYPFALGVMAMLLEFIPYIGPIIAGLFGVFFALTLSPSLALITAVGYYIMQWLENNLLVPKIMQRAAGINPVLSIVSILICFDIFGVIGVFLGVPIASLVVAIVQSFVEEKDASSSEAVQEIFNS